MSFVVWSSFILNFSLFNSAGENITDKGCVINKNFYGTKKKKADLIRSIQTAEGPTGCFGTSDGQCAYAECCFMQDCFKISLAEQKQTAEHLKQQIGELTAANKQLQQEIAERQQEITERQQEITERQQTENELEQYSNQLEQQIEKQTTELAAANGNFRLQTAECQRLEQCFIQLRTKLDNINSIIKDQLELREGGPKVLKSSTSAPAPLGCTYN